MNSKSQGSNGPQIVQTFIEADVHVTQVDCGDVHSVALDTDGRVYTWGGGGPSQNKGQCGHGDL